MKTIEKPGRLLSATLKAARKVKLDDLTRATGFPSSWLRKLLAGTIKNPSVNRVEKVYEAVTKKRLGI